MMVGMGTGSIYTEVVGIGTLRYNVTFPKLHQFEVYNFLSLISDIPGLQLEPGRKTMKMNSIWRTEPLISIQRYKLVQPNFD